MCLAQLLTRRCRRRITAMTTAKTKAKTVEVAGVTLTLGGLYDLWAEPRPGKAHVRDLLDETGKKRIERELKFVRANMYGRERLFLGRGVVVDWYYSDSDMDRIGADDINEAYRMVHAFAYQYEVDPDGSIYEMESSDFQWDRDNDRVTCTFPRPRLPPVMTVGGLRRSTKNDGGPST